MEKIAESELILNADKSIYHLKIQPHQIAKDIIIVGDPNRVKVISDRFDIVEHKIENREFITHTGTLNGKQLSVVGSGIGTDNIDIVLNELDALVNIDFDSRTIKKEKTALNIVRIGTCGVLQEDIDVDSFIVSEYALGLDGLLNYYEHQLNDVENKILNQFIDFSKYPSELARPYVIEASKNLHQLFKDHCYSGITATAPGFYGPQGRVLRMPLRIPDLNQLLNQFNIDGYRVNNFEMETSAIYALSRVLGHNACTVCVAVANRFKKEISKDYHQPLSNLIDLVLHQLTR